MSRKAKRNLVNGLVIGVILMVLGIIFIPMITVSTTAIANQTFAYKFVDWFTKLKTNLVNNSAFYLLAIVLIAVTLYVRRYLRIK